MTAQISPRILDKGDRSVAGLYEQTRGRGHPACSHVLRPVYDRLNGADGFVSLEVSPYLANDTRARSPKLNDFGSSTARI